MASVRQPITQLWRGPDAALRGADGSQGIAKPARRAVRAHVHRASKYSTVAQSEAHAAGPRFIDPHDHASAGGKRAGGCHGRMRALRLDVTRRRPRHALPRRRKGSARRGWFARWNFQFSERNRRLDASGVTRLYSTARGNRMHGPDRAAIGARHAFYPELESLRGIAAMCVSCFIASSNSHCRAIHFSDRRC